MKKIILISLILLNTLMASMMSMPMKMMGKGARMGLTIPMARDMMEEGKIFAVDVFTERNNALRDKTYLYGSMKNENKEESYLAKILLERSFQLDKDSFTRIGAIVGYENEETKWRVHTLYYDVDFFLNSLNIKLGREIKDFGYDSHFNVIDFLGKYDYLYNHKNVFMERNSTDSVSVRLNDTSGNHYVSFYFYENDLSDDVEDSNYLLEMSALNRDSKSSIFINVGKKKTSMALATRRSIGRNTSIKSSIRYDKHKDKAKHKSLSSSSSVLYNVTDNFLLGADYGAWKEDTKGDDDSITLHHTIYTKLKLGNLRLKAGYIKDEKRKTNISLGYYIGNTKIYMDGFIDAENEDENLIRFMISYLN